MLTVWTGSELILSFDDGKDVVLNTEETKEFEKWFNFKHKEANKLRKVI